MKGIIKYNHKLYKRSNKPCNQNNIKKGDLIQLHCKRGCDYFQYNGIHEVVSNQREIHIKIEDNIILCIKIGYIVSYADVSKLEITTRIKSLPNIIKEESEY